MRGSYSNFAVAYLLMDCDIDAALQDAFWQKLENFRSNKTPPKGVFVRTYGRKNTQTGKRVEEIGDDDIRVRGAYCRDVLIRNGNRPLPFWLQIASSPSPALTNTVLSTREEGVPATAPNTP